VGREPARVNGVEFALLGHQESWPRISSIVHALRDPDRPRLAEEDVRQVASWIPPRTLVRSRVSSIANGRSARGVYIETFVAPDELEARAFHRAIEKVREAVTCAAREGAQIAALGGFTSIVLEGRPELAEAPEGLALTTGNSLTSALIVKGVEAAAGLLGIGLSHASLLVVGSTGDIGSACAGYFATKVRRLLLSARNAERLRRQEDSLRRSGVDATASTDLRRLLRAADVVVCAASLAAPALEIDECRPGALVCDAGYPKNLRPGNHRRGAPHVFWGGMGQCTGGWESDSPLLDIFYSFPAARVAHGCLLEGVALALERRFESFSQGRGRITPERIEEIWEIASRHGIVLAPLFGPDGLWPTTPVAGGNC